MSVVNGVKDKQQKQTYSPRHDHKILYALSRVSIVKIYNDCQSQNRLKNPLHALMAAQNIWKSPCTDLLSKRSRPLQLLFMRNFMLTICS